MAGVILSGLPVKIQVVITAKSRCVCSPNWIFGVFVVPFAEFDVRLPHVGFPLTRVDVHLSARLCALGFPSTRLTDGFLGGREMLMAGHAPSRRLSDVLCCPKASARGGPTSLSLPLGPTDRVPAVPPPSAGPGLGLPHAQRLRLEPLRAPRAQ